MDTARIKEIRKSKEKAARRKYDNFQASGTQKYYYEYEHYSDLVDICDIALNVSEIRDKSTKMFVDLGGIVEDAYQLKKSGDYYDPQSVKNFLDQVLLIGRQHGFEKESRGSFR